MESADTSKEAADAIFDKLTDDLATASSQWKSSPEREALVTSVEADILTQDHLVIGAALCLGLCSLVDCETINRPWNQEWLFRQLLYSRPFLPVCVSSRHTVFRLRFVLIEFRYQVLNRPCPLPGSYLQDADVKLLEQRGRK